MPIHFNHQLGTQFSPLQHKAIKEAYQIVYAFAGAEKKDHFIFTSSGAEGVNHAVFAAYLDITRKTGKNHFLCSSLDEAPAIMAMSRLQELGCVFQMIPADSKGQVSVKSVAEMITPRTAMLSLSWATALTGVLQPVAEIAEVCRDRGVLFHVEASHVLGKGDFSFEGSCADILTFQGKPTGGGLFFRENVSMSPFILGGNEQAGMRGGHLHFSQITELAKWAKEELASKDHYGMEIARLRALFEQQICFKIPSAKPLFQKSQRVPHISCFLFPKAASDALYFLLHHKGVEATFGGGRLQHLSHILKACHFSDYETQCGLSFGFSSDLVEEEIHLAVEHIVETVCKLQKCSGGLCDEL